MEKINMLLLLTLLPNDAKSMSDFLMSKGLHVYQRSIETVTDTYAVGLYVSEDEIESALNVLHEIGMGMRRLRNSSLAAHAEILIPVDLSPKSISACKVGFELAERLSTTASIIHTISPQSVELNLSGSKDDKNGRPTKKSIKLMLEEFTEKLRQHQSQRQLPMIDFNTELLEGLPEDCILEKARTVNPKLIVMATRTRRKRAEEMVGSVTAEVLDLCRVPLFTVPEEYECPGIRNISRLIFFCHGDKHDIESMNQFLSLFEFPKVKITLLPVNDRVRHKARNYVDNLAEYFSVKYPNATFNTLVLNRDNFLEEFKAYLEKENIELLIVQNKKKNIFSRLLNPGIAHILLYERDMPMIILPV